jgi:predicted O-methyltransferase YrrM
MNLFDKIESIIPKCDGWCSKSKGMLLGATIMTIRPETVLEIGVFGGSSFFPMALAIKEVGRGTLIGVDPWVASESKVGQLNPADEKFWSECDHNAVFDKFMGFVRELQVENCVKIERTTSDAYSPPAKLDLIHLDGNHGEQAYKDAQKFLPRVRVGGFAFLDDLDWTGGAVRRAAAYAKSIGFVQLAVIDTGAYFQRMA